MADATEVKLHFLDYWRVIRIRAGIIVLAFLLVVISAGVATYFTPKRFTSSVFMELRSTAQTMSAYNPMGMQGTGDPRFGPTQFEIIQRKEILYPVIDTLNLTTRWSSSETPIPRDIAYRILRGMLGVKQVRNTEILELTATSTKPDEASEIVNTVAEIYQQKIVELEQGRKDVGLGSLDDQIKKQEEQVAERFAEVRRLGEELRALNIVDLNVAMPGDLQDPSREMLMAKEGEVNAARTSLAALQSQLRQIEQMDKSELINSITTMEVADPSVQRILPQFQEAKSTEARLLNSGLGPKHPEVVSLRAQMAVFESQLGDADVAIRGSLESRLKVSQSQLAALEKQLDEARNRQQDARSASSEYIEAKDRYLQANAQLQNMRASLQMQRTELTMPRMPAIIWERAEPALSPSSPNVTLNMTLATIVGLITALGLAFFIEYLDTSVKTLEEVENYLGVPVLAVVPNGISNLGDVGSETADAEAYRILRTNVEFNRKTPTANTITVVSGGVGEGKTTTIHNLGYIFAQGGYSTVLVDADLRRPAQHRLLHDENEVGLATYLMSAIPIDDVIKQTKQQNLFSITSGKSSTQAIGYLNSQRMTDLIVALKNRFDIVLIDSPPILGVSDASVIVSEADCTIIVVQHRRFPRAMLQRVKQAVLNVGGNIIGVVLNNVDVKHDAAYGYYTSYYDYYAVDGGKKKRKNSKRKADAETKTGSAPKAVTAARSTKEGDADAY